MNAGAMCSIPASSVHARSPMPDSMGGAPEGYRLGKRLRSGPRSELREGMRLADGTPVLLKSYLDDRSDDPASRVQRELDLMRRIASPGIPRALDLDRTTPRPLLVLEQLPGLSLTHHLRGGPLDLPTWLQLASGLAETLTQIHAAHVLHKDLTPNNVLYDLASGRVWICDFGMAIELGAAERAGRPLTQTLDASLLYIAPEQTGRMNRGCDARSDLYSLGATLYHALVGRPPFESSDALELIHAHIARLPAAPKEQRAELPEALSRVILKLLRKEPEERYQSARALHADLVLCQQQLARSGVIGELELGSAEAPERPRFAARLYGRERESALLRGLYESAAQGSVRSLWIRGEPGAGKSALADELRALLARTGGYLAVGKFDLYRDRPYAGWIAALASLVQQMLVESDARLERWQAELRAGLGNIAHALLDHVPDLEFIVGDVPPVPTLGARETQARLSLALQRLVATCATPEHPLVLFLDDLQWSDAGSRVLLEELLTSATDAALLVVAVYRIADVGAEHPVSILLRHLQQRGAPVELLELGPLSTDAVAQMLADALERPVEVARELAELVERRTGNSPLLVREFVAHVQGRGLLRYERSSGWLWDMAQLRAADIPESAVALMMGKIDRLLPEPRALLKFASCVGDEFDAELLGELCRRSRAELESALYALADAGLILPCSRGFRFVHDRIREAAQELLSSAERAQVHYDIARLLLERTPESARADRAGEIAEHLNRGIVHVQEDLRLTAMELNRMAGKRALGAGAGPLARTHFAQARALAREGDWEAHAPLLLDLALQAAESAFQSGDFPGALAQLAELEGRRFETMERVHIAAKRLQILVVSEAPENAALYLVRLLRGFGVFWPIHPSPLRARLALRVVRWLLRKRREPDLLFPATSLKPRSLTVPILLGSGSAALARVDVHLAVLATCFSMRRSIREGYITRPGYPVAIYAAYLQILLGDAVRAQELARCSLALAERVPDTYTPRTQLVVYGLLYPFLMRRRQAVVSMERIAEASSELGDPEFAYYARFMHRIFLALAGDPVRETGRQLEQMAAAVRNSEQWFPEVSRCCASWDLLGSRNETSATFDAAIERVDAMFEQGSTGSTYACTLWMLVMSVYGRHALAFARSESVIGELFRSSPFVHVADHLFYRGLAAAVLAGTSRGSTRRRYARDLRRSLRYLQRRAEDGPDFVHMSMLLRAELARLRRDPARARICYEQAVQRARQQAFPHHAALAQERRASLLVGLRRESEAQAALEDAFTLYRDWGAEQKARLLKSGLRGIG